MLYLIHYDRKQSKVLSFKEYQDFQHSQAFDDRLALEIEHNIQDGEQEIVLLEAANKQQLKRTHPKYVPASDGEKLLLAGLAVALLAALSRA